MTTGRSASAFWNLVAALLKTSMRPTWFCGTLLAGAKRFNNGINRRVRVCPDTEIMGQQWPDMTWLLRLEERQRNCWNPLQWKTTSQRLTSSFSQHYSSSLSVSLPPHFLFRLHPHHLTIILPLYLWYFAHRSWVDIPRRSPLRGYPPPSRMVRERRHWVRPGPLILGPYEVSSSGAEEYLRNWKAYLITGNGKDDVHIDQNDSSWVKLYYQGEWSNGLTKAFFA